MLTIKNDTYALQPNLWRLFPGVYDNPGDAVEWNYNMEVNGAQHIRQSNITHKICVDTTFCLKQLQTAGAKTLSFQRTHPMMSAPPALKAPYVLLAYLGQDSVRRSMVIPRADYDTGFVTYLFDKSIIHRSHPVYVAETEWYSPQTSVIGFFNREFSPVFLTSQLQQNIYGHNNSTVMNCIKGTHPYVKYTLRKLESLLRGINFCGIISLTVHQEGDMIYVDNVLTTLHDVEIYGLLTYFVGCEPLALAKFFEALTSPLGFSKVDCGGDSVFKEQSKVLVETMTLPPYPITKAPVSDDAGMFGYSKGLKLKYDPDSDTVLFTRDSQLSAGNNMTTTGPVVGALCVRGDAVEDMRKLTSQAYKSLGQNNFLTLHKFKEEINYVSG